MIPYALGAGALLGALSQLSPWVFLGLLVGFWLPERVRWAALGAFALVMLRASTLGDPWAARIGQEVTLEGQLHRGFLWTPQGKVYVRHFPPLEDGAYRLEGLLARPQPKRNPGGFDQSLWLKGLGVKAVLEVRRVLYRRPASPTYHDRYRQTLQHGLSPEVAALATALTLGEREGLGELYEAFQRAGLAHALALSGLNVGILVGAGLILLYPLGPRRYWAALPLAWAYVLLAGPSPSLLRASLMATVVLLALALGKGRNALLSGWMLALAAHLAWEPYAVFSLSFQLSYLAVLGIAVLLPALPRPRGWRGYLAEVFALTLSAQAFLIPLLLHNFHRLALLSPLANLAVLPLLNLLVPLTFIKGLWSGFAGILAPPIEVLSQLSIELTRWLARGPQLFWGEISPSGFALYYLGLAPLVLALYNRLPWRRALMLGSAALLSSILPAQFQRAEIWQLDVGQGDASLIRLPDQTAILVDGGRPYAAERVVRALDALGIPKLDLVVATHPDADHIAALPEVLAEVPVGRVLAGPPQPRDPLDLALRKAAQDAGVPVSTVVRGSSLRLGQARLSFLGPRGDEPDDNGRSLVFVLEWRGRRALFTGDAPTVAEEDWPALPVHLLKVGHHGSKTSTGEELLEKTRPKVALIGVGRNNYGHPAAEVLHRLERYSVEVHRTDWEGAIRVQLW
ncbi:MULTISPECIES: DNA internalization-related competence protein ComEC/Rec2 [unclassified Meiothermus]|uniref:DNA internalization-related competence protein ComEC/Rec2 n=1 Tax=unclassified Meiothermus TaxID=370471 RepID=UPI000D7C2836|nr:MULTISPECIES: DNA internalization-related competence protein ComEC/Rec2 [unclassified Meiothermus]PZA05876.1 DNA internalization-related competence protein ComEC/Rec2 [Meiothermus sp. Pnk-1]RYM29417.1 DNA internalization-related competence protein ComEC/Rec2 [Meiothermus sp. PNK-Is4]